MTTEPQADIVERLRDRKQVLRDDGTCRRSWAATSLDLAAAAEITRLRARLEVEPGWSESADGIACRDETIRLQDAHITRLRAELAEARIHGRREGLEAAASWLREKEGAWRWLTSNYPSIGAPHVPRVLADQVLAIAPPTLMKDAGHGHA